MNSSTKILSALALGGLLAGTALAGPGDAHSRSASLATQDNPVTIGLFRSNNVSSTKTDCLGMTKQTKLLPNANPKARGLQEVVVGYRCKGMADAG